ncbi:MAG: hypothetical protein J6Y69_04570 [Treponema sp.]|nr:hypothetical protein [Treponema sp.]
MTKILRFFICAAVLLCVTAELCFARKDFSADDVVVEFLDPMSRANFQASLANSSLDSLKETFFNGLGPDQHLKEFFQITGDKMDEEDSAMLDFVQDNLSKINSLVPNNVYETLVTRNMAQEKMAMDGWIVLTQYNGGSDFYHCIFYFMIISD